MHIYLHWKQLLSVALKYYGNLCLCFNYKNCILEIFYTRFSQVKPQPCYFFLIQLTPGTWIVFTSKCREPSAIDKETQPNFNKAQTSIQSSIISLVKTRDIGMLIDKATPICSYAALTSSSRIITNHHVSPTSIRRIDDFLWRDNVNSTDMRRCGRCLFVVLGPGSYHSYHSNTCVLDKPIHFLPSR